jgi:hypothetical protein
LIITLLLIIPTLPYGLMRWFLDYIPIELSHLVPQLKEAKSADMVLLW